MAAIASIARSARRHGDGVPRARPHGQSRRRPQGPEPGARAHRRRRPVQREIRVASRLEHPNILRVLDSARWRPPLVHHAVRAGEDLGDLLLSEPSLPLPRALAIIRAVGAALTAAHEQGVVHRDIKPDNILLEGDHVMVADFGVARAVSDMHEKLTATGMVVGTPVYMSPEQAAARRKSTAVRPVRPGERAVRDDRGGAAVPGGHADGDPDAPVRRPPQPLRPVFDIPRRSSGHPAALERSPRTVRSVSFITHSKKSARLRPAPSPRSFPRLTLLFPRNSLQSGATRAGETDIIIKLFINFVHRLHRQKSSRLHHSWHPPASHAADQQVDKSAHMPEPIPAYHPSRPRSLNRRNAASGAVTLTVRNRPGADQTRRRPRRLLPAADSASDQRVPQSPILPPERAPDASSTPIGTENTRRRYRPGPRWNARCCRGACARFA